MHTRTLSLLPQHAHRGARIGPLRRRLTVGTWTHPPNQHTHPHPCSTFAQQGVCHTLCPQASTNVCVAPACVCLCVCVCPLHAPPYPNRRVTPAPFECQQANHAGPHRRHCPPAAWPKSSRRAPGIPPTPQGPTQPTLQHCRGRGAACIAARPTGIAPQTPSSHAGSRRYPQASSSHTRTHNAHRQILTPCRTKTQHTITQHSSAARAHPRTRTHNTRTHRAAAAALPLLPLLHPRWLLLTPCR